MRDRIGAGRARAPLGRAEFDQRAGPQGSLHAGSPGAVTATIAGTARALELTRFDLHNSVG